MKLLSLSRTSLAIAACVFSCSNALLSTSGTTVVLNDIAYYVPPNPVATLAVPASVSGYIGFTPVTIVQATGSFTAADLTSTVSNYTATDDVFQSGFLESVFVQQTGAGSAKYKRSSGSANITMLPVTEGAPMIPSGPYFMSSSGALHEAYRLYSDVTGSFSETVIANADGTYSVLPANIVGQSLAVAVPSRLYYTPTSEKPLAGVRLGVKDIYDLAGLKTSNGNRAWYFLYPAADANAFPVQRLIDAGAIIVGKMITSQFANGEAATADWVDYHEPFNPRGDGYQDTSSSSSGPGAGEGAYEWLDVTLGSDTGGSVRGPAQVQGVYGNRPSHDIVRLENTMPMAPQLDTAGLLCRDPVLWATAAKAMYGDNLTLTDSYPSAIKTFGFPTTAVQPGDELLIDFVTAVSDFLAANVSTFNITTAWAETGPSGAPPLTSLLNLTYPTLISKNQIKLIRDPFYTDYAAVHDGRLPFVDPVPLVRWGWAQNSTTTIEEAVANKTLFMDWFAETVLIPDPDTCSDSLLMYVGSKATTLYRNVYRSPPQIPAGFDTGSISIFAEVPDMVVPIGEAEYFSPITNHTELLPVTVDFLAAKGCDGLIFSLVEDLYKAGIVKVSKAGGSSISGGEILYKRWQHTV